jgi:uncharacterized protein (TIGR03382 family)
VLAVIAAAAVVGGSPADAMPAVVALAQGDHVVCSGALVAPRVVVTAAHCAADDLLAGVGWLADLRDARWLDVDFAAPHTDFNPATHDDDIAVLVLAEDVPSWAAPLVRGAAPTNGSVTVVGFGHASADGADAHIRNLGTSRVVLVDDERVRLAPAPSLPCYGDSGGVVLTETAEGTRFAALIVGGDAGCAESSFALRIDAYGAFLDPVIADPDNWLEVDDPHTEGCDAGGPSAGGSVASVLLSVLALRRRRRL